SIGIDIGGEQILRRRRRRFAGLGRGIDLAPRFFLDALDRRAVDAGGGETLAIELDRVALHPAFELARRPVFRRIGARMAAVAIGFALDKRRAVAGAGPGEDAARGAEDLVGVIAVEDDALEPIG